MRTIAALLLTLVLVGCPAKVQPPSPSATPPPSATPAPAAPVTAAVETAFEGVWATKDDAGDPFDMIIFPNGQAVTNWSKGLDGAKGERGFWRKENGKLIAIYEDGWTDVLEPSADGFVHKGFSPGTQIGGPPTNSAKAEKVTSSAATYAGVWRLNREPGGTFQYVALFSGGRALSTVNGGTEGSWEITEKGVLCTWPKDGWVDLIAHGPEGWQKRSWVGAENDTPADISPVARVGEEKFSVAP